MVFNTHKWIPFYPKLLNKKLIFLIDKTVGLTVPGLLSQSVSTEIVFLFLINKGVRVYGCKTFNTVFWVVSLYKKKVSIKSPPSYDKSKILLSPILNRNFQYYLNKNSKHTDINGTPTYIIYVRYFVFFSYFNRSEEFTNTGDWCPTPSSVIKIFSVRRT